MELFNVVISGIQVNFMDSVAAQTVKVRPTTHFKSFQPLPGASREEKKPKNNKNKRKKTISVHVLNNKKKKNLVLTIEIR